MYEYTGICLCARTDKLVHRCVCDCVSVYTQTSAQISISKQAFVWEVRVHKCMGVRMYVCMVCMYVCMYVCMCACGCSNNSVWQYVHAYNQHFSKLQCLREYLAGPSYPGNICDAARFSPGYCDCLYLAVCRCDIFTVLLVTVVDPFSA